MKCEYCGFENEKDFSFCPNCGAAAHTAAPAEASVSPLPENPAAEKVLQALKDPLFLVLCILISASCVLGLLSGGSDILSILFTVFLWLTYAKARNHIADVSHLRSVSGTVYAQYIVVNVVSILLIVVGVIVGLVLSVLDGDAAFMNELLYEAQLDAETLALFNELSAAVIGLVFLLVFVVIGVVMLVVNLFSNRYIHRFAKSVYQSIASGTLALKHTKTAYGWLIAFGVFSGVSLLGDLSSGNFSTILSSGASCAAPIIAAILINKHLTSEE